MNNALTLQVGDTRIIRIDTNTIIGIGSTVAGPVGATGPAGAQGPIGTGGVLGFYGAFSDSNDQTASANTATAMLLRTTDEANGVSIVSNSQITFANAGTYNLQWSAQFVNTDSQEHDVSVWLKKNNADVAGSTGIVGVPAKKGVINGHTLPSWNFVFTVADGDYFEFYWSTPDTGVTIEAFPSAVSPTRPSTASIVVTATQVMYTQLGPTGDTGVQISATAPANTEVLWADTTVVSSDGMVPRGGTIGQALVKNSGTDYALEWASVGSAARPLLTGGAYLSGSGLGLGELASNYASAPDSAALSITGDIDIQCKVSLVDWTPSAIEVIAAKESSASTRSYRLAVNTSGVLALTTSGDGSAIVTTLSSAATGVANKATKWVRATLDSDNGSGSNLVKFYLSDDGSTWTQLGTTVTTAGTRAIFDSTSPLEVGSRFLGTQELFAGTVYRAIVRNGYDGAGSTVFDANFETQTADALAFTESSTNAATVTINTTRYSYGIPEHQGSSTATTASAANTDYYFPFRVTQSTVVDMIGFEITTGPASSSTTHMAVYSADDNLNPTGSPLITASQAVATSATGIYRQQVTPVTLPPGNYLAAFNNTVAMTYRLMRGGVSPFYFALGASPFVTGRSAGRVSATFTSSPTTPVTWLAGASGAQHFLHFRYKAAT